MGTITGQLIFDRAAIKAQDAGAVRWPGSEALLWLNDAQREIVSLLPKANPVRVDFTLVAGSRQALPAGGLAVIDVVRLLSGTADGRPVRLVDRAALDERKPAWHTDTHTTGPRHWTMDDRDPKAFYVWPGGVGIHVELIHSALPTDLGSLASTIALDDTYAHPMQLFLLFSFFSKNQVYSKNPQLATGLYATFLQSLGLGDKAKAYIAARAQQQAAGA